MFLFRFSRMHENSGVHTKLFFLETTSLGPTLTLTLTLNLISNPNLTPDLDPGADWGWDQLVEKVVGAYC